MRRAAGILCTLLIAGAVVAACRPAPASADGDPASDVLLGQNVFYPYDPVVPIAVQHRLNAVVNRAQAAGLELKVALIGQPKDLGVVPSLFGSPQRYASFLEREISFQRPIPLLVVMSAGYGVEGMGTAARRVAAQLPRPTGTVRRNSTELARAAMAAVPSLARAAGHPLPGGSAGASTANGSGGGGNRGLLLALLVLAAVLVAATLLGLRLREVIRAR